MLSHNQSTGRLGEDRAVVYLRQRGYRIVERNWRHKHSEIDIIALDGETWVFVEVKTRKSLMYGYPEENIHPRKVASVQNAATAYLAAKSGIPEIRFDVIAICHENGKEQLQHFEDAF